MLRNFENKSDVVVLDLESVQDGRKGILLELNVNDGTDDGPDLTGVGLFGGVATGLREKVKNQTLRIK